MSSRPRPPCRSAADLRHLCRCCPPPPEGAFGLTVANANGGDSVAVASLPPLFRPRQKRKRRRSRLHSEALGSSRGGVLTRRQFPPHNTINQIIFPLHQTRRRGSNHLRNVENRFVCFRPPRDLDSKACVTIGEKVPSPTFPAPPPFIQSHSRFKPVFSALLCNFSLFTLASVCFWFGTVPHSPSRSLSTPPQRCG